MAMGVFYGIAKLFAARTVDVHGNGDEVILGEKVGLGTRPVRKPRPARRNPFKASPSG